MASTDEELAAKLAERKTKRSSDSELQAKLDARRSGDWKKGLEGRYAPQLGHMSTLEAMGRAAENGLTLGAMPSIAAAGTSSDALSHLLRKAKGIPERPADDRPFAVKRDAERAKDQEAEEGHPLAYALTELGSSIPTASALGGPIRSLKDSVRAGGTVGAMLGLNNSKADLTQGEVGQAAADTGKGAGIGAVLGPLGYGIAKTGEVLGNKAADAVFNLRSLLGGNPAPSIPRALDALGVTEGSGPNERVQALTDQKIVPPEDFPPAAFNKASESAPDAMARVGKHPRVQVAQEEGILASKRGLGAVDEMSEAGDPRANAGVVSALVDLRRGKIPRASTSMGLVGDAIAQSLKAARRLGSTDENLARAISSPETKAELLQIIAAGRQPNLSGDAIQALATRGLALLQASDLGMDKSP